MSTFGLGLLLVPILSLGIYPYNAPVNGHSGLNQIKRHVTNTTGQFPVTTSEADTYKLTNPAWKAETLRYLADGIHRAHTSAIGSTTVDLDRFDATGAAVITSNTAVGQGKVQFSVNLPLREIQTIRIVQPKYSRNLAIELVTHNQAQTIHVWRKMSSGRSSDTFKASMDRISFVAPETASGAQVLAELLAGTIRDAGGSPVILINSLR